jgi:hypothetical protein
LERNGSGAPARPHGEVKENGQLFSREGNVARFIMVIETDRDEHIPEKRVLSAMLRMIAYKVDQEQVAKEYCDLMHGNGRKMGRFRLIRDD